ncbi:Toxin-antitoxin system, toxin component, PIN family [uncultured Desulfobacterium sp.]|uniref:Toxin-antitoxin system, toxin component, PIN family n=1 Tax=uncultured Desulfobacterium sp. TaxID=201089 RepID=A0A445N130_9BACT|nr:Toxin-antitoxin system, toxin component, PIN family [uncultured Desulfobacterium sp.]
MKTLFDTNVILDVFLDREPFSSDAAILLSKVERSEIIGFICATTVTTIHYLTTKALGPQAASKHIQSLLSLFVIAPVNRVILENAAASKFPDFEDAVLYEAACHAGAKYIVTRNIDDFKNSKLPVFEPKEFINVLESLKNNS